MDRFHELVAFLARNRMGTEPLWDTAKRILITRTPVETGTQIKAAKALGCSQQVISYYAKPLKPKGDKPCDSES